MLDQIIKAFWDNYDPIKDVVLFIIALIGAVPQVNKLIINKPNLIIKDSIFYIANDDRLYFSYQLRNEMKWHRRTSDAVNLWAWTSLVDKNGGGHKLQGIRCYYPNTQH